MERVQKSPGEVEQFLARIRKVQKEEDNVIVNNASWANNRVNKTREYMAETGIKKLDIMKVIKGLRVCNYSYTTLDRNENFAGDQIWIFGTKFRPVDETHDIYIKLKIQELGEEYLRILSFHPESPTQTEGKLTFPYKDYDEDNEN